MNARNLIYPAILLSLTFSAFAQDRLVPSVYPTIQAAINAAENNDVVIIADGVYKGSGNREVHFLGKAITVRSANGPGSCVVDCNYAGTGFYFNNNETSASVLEGIAITNGYPYATSTVNSSPIIRNCVISYSSGIYCAGGSPSIIGCTIDSCWQVSIKLSSCISANITGCSITNGTGIYGSDSTADINACVIKFNSAQYYGRDQFGGGIYWEGGSATIRNCDISNNNAQGVPSPPPEGFCPPGCMPGCDPITMPGCMPCWGPCPPEPAGSGFGGGICGRYNASLELLNCLIIGNSAEGGGGEICGCAYGGGIYCDTEATLTVHNCTISNNSAQGWSGCGWYSSGGGIFKYYSEGGGTATIESSIIWGNFSSSGSDSEIGGDAAGITVISSDIGPEIWSGSMNADPFFATGPLGDYYLSSTAAGQSYNSPCINAGDNPSSVYGLDSLTTSTDNYPDFGTVDMGYHYEISEQPSLILLDPNGGETFIAGKQHTVRWDSTGSVRNVRIEYSTNNGSSWQEVYPANYGNTGSYQWTIPAVDSDQCLVKTTEMTLPGITDTSDGAFTIFICHLTADLNGDCKVNLTDLAQFASQWLQSGNPFEPGQ